MSNLKNYQIRVFFETIKEMTAGLCRELLRHVLSRT